MNPSVPLLVAGLLALPLTRTLAAEVGATPASGGVQPTQGEDWLAPQDRAELDLMVRRGELDEALLTFEEILEEIPGDAPTRVLYARALARAGRWEAALAEARRAAGVLFQSDTGLGDLSLARLAARELASILLNLGRAPEALVALDGPGAREAAELPEERWLRGQVLMALGRRGEAEDVLRAASEAQAPDDWRGLLAQARCQRALGRIEKASATLVAADRAARTAGGVEPDVLVELGEVYFEFYGEVDDAIGNAHSPRELFDEALKLSPGHTGALLGLYELHRFNWNRNSRRAGEILEELLSICPNSIRGLLAQSSSALDDGDLRLARTTLERLEALAPERRDVRTQKAALAWVDHRRDEAREILETLAASDPGDSKPTRELGRHLLELYRFREGLPFLEEAVERDPTDFLALRELGRAQANTGDEDSARESLERSREAAQGRRDAWRDNMRLVLRRMQETFVEHEIPNLTFTWLPDAAAVLKAYLVPFYSEAREELAARYGYTPDPVRIEVFRRWGDFSVRSTGFEGFPALGVCFGPVVTAVSPLEPQLRGGFSWARTSYHEFTHVIHLGLSHNRCPRWVTEGLATWEEGRRNPSWWRNYRRELVDARANDELIRVRRLNGAFRGPRVLFAYYQSGLLCKLLIEEHGFSSMVKLLEAFDGGADLDRALGQVFDTTPEALDERFATFVDGIISDLRIEPRWSRSHTFKRRFALSRRPPEDPEALRAWQNDWCDVGWGDLGAGRTVDAEEVLKLVESAGAVPPRALFLRGEIALSKGLEDQAQDLFSRGIEAGGEDFRARMTLGALAMGAGDSELALEHLRAAEADFPGFDDPGLSAELRIADLLEREGDSEGAMEARLRWLAWNAGEDRVRLAVARWLAEEGRGAEAIPLLEEVNQVDPFRRSLHLDLARLYFEQRRYGEALREAEVGLVVPAELDRDLQSDGHPTGAGIDEEAWHAMAVPLWEWKAQSLARLDRTAEAEAVARELLRQEQDNAVALELLGGDAR